MRHVTVTSAACRRWKSPPRNIRFPPRIDASFQVGVCCLKYLPISGVCSLSFCTTKAAVSFDIAFVKSASRNVSFRKFIESILTQ